MEPAAQETQAPQGDDPLVAPRSGTARARLRVAVVGHVCIDSNVVDGVSREQPGSPGFFIAASLRGHHDITVSLIAPHGSDVRALAPWLPFASNANGRESLRFENTIVGDIRTQRATGIALAEPHPLTRAERRAIRAADVLILAPLVDRFPARYVRTVIDAASPDALVALLPQGLFRVVGEDGVVTAGVADELEQIAQEASLIVFSEEDAPDSEYAAWRLAELDGHALVVLTRAAAGARIVTDLDSLDVPTTPVPPRRVLSPVGAGDVFAAACAIALRRGASPAVAVAAAHAAAAAHLLRPAVSQR